MQDYALTHDMLVEHVCTCQHGTEAIDRLKKYLQRSTRRDELCKVGKSGLYFNTETNKYVIGPGGVPATLAHFAAVRGRTDVLEVLFEFGVSMHVPITDVSGIANVTPLVIAVQNDHQAAKNFLTAIVKPGRSSLDMCTIA